MIELGTRMYSHYSSAESYENKIDRIFWSVPPWASRNMFLSCPKFPSPFDFHVKGLSDHSPVAFSCSCRTSAAEHHRSIPSFITRSKVYRDVLKGIEQTQ
eukprot:9387416-Karenia_brevis.AAC.1